MRGKRLYVIVFRPAAVKEPALVRRSASLLALLGPDLKLADRADLSDPPATIFSIRCAALNS